MESKVFKIKLHNISLLMHITNSDYNTALFYMQSNKYVRNIVTTLILAMKLHNSFVFHNPKVLPDI